MGAPVPLPPKVGPDRAGFLCWFGVTTAGSASATQRTADLALRAMRANAEARCTSLLQVLSSSDSSHWRVPRKPPGALQGSRLRRVEGSWEPPQECSVSEVWLTR